MIWQPRHTWQRHGDLYWRGHVLIGDAVIDFTTVHPDVFANEGTARLWLRTLNGCFALVYAPQGRVRLAAVDSGRTIPLFYDTREPRLLDRIPPDEVRVRDLTWLGRKWWHDLEFLPGNHTLDPKIRSLTPRQMLWSAAGAQRVLSYAEAPVQQPAVFSAPGAGRLYKETLLGALERTIALAKGRPLVVMLSGGFDSRAILAGLHALGYLSLHALTYGIPESDEYRRAQAVTEALEIPHHFIDYRRPDLQEYVKKQLGAYTDFAANAQSVPQEQEWPAAYAASQLPEIREGVFLLGLGGDTYGGAPVPQHYFRVPGRRSTRGVQDWMLHRYTRISLARGRTLLSQYLPAGPFEDESAITDAVRDWLIRERLAKYMFNGLRSYEYAGLDWYLPLWDQALREFWRSVPIDMLRRREHYRRWTAELLLEPTGALLPDEPLPLPPVWRTEWVPPSWKRRSPARRDPNGLHELLLPALQQTLGDSDIPRTINEWMGRYTTARYSRPN